MNAKHPEKFILTAMSMLSCEDCPQDRCNRVGELSELFSHILGTHFSNYAEEIR